MNKQPINKLTQNTSSTQVVSSNRALMPQSSVATAKPKIPKPPKIDNFKSMKALLYQRKRPNARQMALYRRMISGTSK